jgi:hypothetical protein
MCGRPINSADMSPLLPLPNISFPSSGLGTHSDKLRFSSR